MKMPGAIECSVRKQNVQFMHSRMQYSLEYFQFIKKLLTCNSVYLNPPPGTFPYCSSPPPSLPPSALTSSLPQHTGVCGP